MITISVLGLDQYVVGHYSKDNTANFASLFETEESEINFVASEAVVLHKGVEQTSWNALVIVRAPRRVEAVESKVADYLIKTLSEFTINLEVNFEYYDEGRHYEHVNAAYPRFIDETNSVAVEGTLGDEGALDDSDEDDDEPDPRDRADLDPNDPDQLFLGDIFKDRGKALGPAAKLPEETKAQKK
jgi:hypothetical protein